jgi:PAS domain S-box-containing protein
MSAITKADKCDVVVITDELDRRPSRPPDHEGENNALRQMAEYLRNGGDSVLEHLARAAMSLTASDAAGISLLETGPGGDVFRWAAAAGPLAWNTGAAIARDAVPCDQVIARDEVMLFDRAHRVFPEIAGFGPMIYESLLTPFHVDGRPAGTVWVVKHSPEKRYDREDARILKSLAGFASLVETRARAEAALRRSEDKFRRVVQGVRDYAIIISDPEDRITDWFPGAEAVFGWTAEEAIGRPGAITFTEEDQERHEPQREIAEAARNGHALDVRWHCRKDGRRVFLEGSVTPLHNDDGTIRGFLKIGQDVTNRRNFEEHQKTLLAELQHRVRNILAVIRSIARRSYDDRQSAQDYVQHLDGRLSALARTQVLLTRSTSAYLDLENMIRDELLAQSARDGQFEIGGPDVRLPPKVAEVLTLAVHELATNAIKYGAFASEEGYLRVTWRLEERPDTRWLVIRWHETGIQVLGPAPRHQGFGFELITRRVPYELHGLGDLKFGPGCLACVLELPLVAGDSILQADGAQGRT